MSNDDDMKFPEGPWDGEPNESEWFDESSGLQCRIIRQPRLGHLCGYVGVPLTHPSYGKSYSQPFWELDDIISGAARPIAFIAKQIEAVRVHGGLTFAGHMKGAHANNWWFGFDCAHAGDVEPYNGVSAIGKPTGWGDSYQYRSFDYVREETMRLADQISKITALQDRPNDKA